LKNTDKQNYAGGFRFSVLDTEGATKTLLPFKRSDKKRVGKRKIFLVMSKLNFFKFKNTEVIDGKGIYGGNNDLPATKAAVEATKNTLRDIIIYGDIAPDTNSKPRG
jgi:hypothetical protein